MTDTKKKSVKKGPGGSKKSTKKKHDVKPELVHEHEDTGVEHAHLDGDKNHSHVDLQPKPFAEDVTDTEELGDTITEVGEPPMGATRIDSPVGLLGRALGFDPSANQETEDERDERLRDRSLQFAAGTHHGMTEEKVVAAAEAYFNFLKGQAKAEVKSIQGE